MKEQQNQILTLHSIHTMLEESLKKNNIKFWMYSDIQSSSMN